MKKILFTICAAAFALCSTAQNSAITKAQGMLEGGKYQQALTVLEGAMTNEKTTKHADVYYWAAQAEFQLFYMEILKASQQMPFDTTLFCNALCKTKEYTLKSHEYDLQPDAKGKAKPHLIEKNQETYKGIIDYMSYPGTMAYQNGNKAKAREYFQMHSSFLDTDLLPAETIAQLKSERAEEYAQSDYFVTYISSELQDWDGVISTADKQINNPKYSRDLMIMKLNAYKQKGDEAGWLAAVKDATLHRQSGADYADELVRHYLTKEDVAGARAQADEMVQQNPDNKFAWYYNGRVAFLLEQKYDAAAEAFAKSRAIDANFPQAYLSEGQCHLQNGINLMTANRTKNAAKYKDEFNKALPLLEKYREMQPESVRTWAPNLSLLYENLDQPEKAKEMEDLLRAQ